VASVPRVACPTHGIKTAVVPWVEPHARYARAFACFAREVLRAGSVQCQPFRAEPFGVYPASGRGGTIAAGAVSG
jgi:hypothetical protein